MSKKFTILGAGAFGSALGQVLTENGHDVTMYDPKLEISLASALASAEVIVLAVPAAAVPSVLPELPNDLPLIVATKGLLTAEPFADFADYMILSGPGFAADIQAHRSTHLTATDPRIVEWFSTDYLDFDQTSDRHGVLMCGALKNVYAILAGLENLQPQTPEWKNFLTEVGGEMSTLLSANGADPATVQLSCGQGDLRITCAEPSRNYEFGQTLRRDPNARPTKTVEGVTALKSVKQGEIAVPGSAEKLHYLMKVSQSWA